MKNFFLIILLLFTAFKVSFAEEETPLSSSQEEIFVEESDFEEDLPALPTSVTSKKENQSTVLEALSKEEPVISQEHNNFHQDNKVVIQGLNKVTAKTSRIETTIGNMVRFGNLEITPKSCWSNAIDEKPDHRALLEIWDNKPKETPQRVFLGWMFSSSPGLSGLEHPVYDISVLSCS